MTELATHTKAAAALHPVTATVNGQERSAAIEAASDPDTAPPRTAITWVGVVCMVRLR